jgi:hypothetical protein
MQLGNQTLGRGKIHFSRFKTGTFTPEGYRYTGNSPSFDLTVNGSNLDHYGSDGGVREKDKSIPVETNRAGKFVLDDIQFESLAWFFFGTAATITQTSATGVVETFVDVIPGLSYHIGLSNATPAGVKGVANVVVKVATVTKTIGTDYTLDADRGIVTIVAGGTIAKDDDVAVTYDRLAKSYDQVISGSSPVAGSIFYEAVNSEGANVDYLMPYVRISPNGDFALKADSAWQNLPFNVDILKAPSREAIYANGQPY